MIRRFRLSLLLALFSVVLIFASDESTKETYSKTGFIEKKHTFETSHFRVNYSPELLRTAKEVATILEGLYDVYKDKYGIVLPNKTEVLISDAATPSGWALAIQNTIAIWTNDFDWNMRGTPNWLENVVAHEYAHIVSISTSFKFPSWMAYMQAGYFTHPNSKGQTNAMHIFPSEVLPPWFFEGIAQYESEAQSGDSWDSHRDMILRRLALSDSLLTWDHMSVFNGRGDDYEKTYNHGFSLIRYIARVYGEDKISQIIRESSKFARLNFDRSIKAVLGISGKELYNRWKNELKRGYHEQVVSLGDTTNDSTISTEGYNNFRPRFGPGENKVYYISNRSALWFGGSLYSYNLTDSAIEKEDGWDTLTDSSKNIIRTRSELPKVTGFYDINNTSRLIIYSNIEPVKGTKFSLGTKALESWNLFSCKLPDDSGRVKSVKKRDVNELLKNRMTPKAVWGSNGKQIATIQKKRDRYTLLISDTTGENLKQVFPISNTTLAVRTIYSLDWSSDGSKIVVDYMDRDSRKIGYYDINTNKFYNICSSGKDERDPRFSPDSKSIVFASARTGIFNIYKYNFKTDRLSQLTNTAGGAFTPDISEDGKKLIYASYTVEGYKIKLAIIDKKQEIELIEIDPVEELGGIESITNPTIYQTDSVEVVNVNSSDSSDSSSLFLDSAKVEPFDFLKSDTVLIDSLVETSELDSTLILDSSVTSDELDSAAIVLNDKSSDTLLTVFPDSSEKSDDSTLLTESKLEADKIESETKLKVDSAKTLVERKDTVQYVDYISGVSRKYSLMPRKILVVPTFISEEVLSKTDAPYEGERVNKFGAIAMLNDPFYWNMRSGTSIMLFLLSESYLGYIKNIGDVSKNKEIAMDFGAMVSTKIFPIDLNFLYFFRNIPSTNEFISDATGFDVLETTEYSIQPRALQLELSKKFGGLKTAVFSSLMNYKVQVNLTDDSDAKTYFGYSPASVFRGGVFASYFLKAPTKARQISPHGIATKLQYEYNYGKFADEENVLLVEDGKIVENNHPYHFNIIKAGLRFGKTSFLAKQLDFEAKFNASLLALTSNSQDLVDSLVDAQDSYEGFPQFFRPAVQVPGYTFYYRADSTEHLLVDEAGDTSFVQMSEDSILASGDAILEGHFAWRFPLSGRKSIDKKIAFLYLDKIYGSINSGGVLVSSTLTALPGKDFQDVLYYGGAEVRMESIIFNNYPLAISLRWDHGFSKPAPIGGDRFTFTVGFEFDNWGIVESPDGARMTPHIMNGYR
jgi:Tol biopolymer transport system component